MTHNLVQTIAIVTSALLAICAEAGAATVARHRPVPAVEGGFYAYRVLHSFTGTEGSIPTGALLRDASGALYGTVNYGAAFNGGAVFKLVPEMSGAYTETTVYAFSQHSAPGFGVIIDHANALYGTTTGGGLGGSGTAFKLVPTTSGYARTLHHTFKGSGAGVSSGLVADTAGTLYGTTSKYAYALAKRGSRYVASRLFAFDRQHYSPDGSSPGGLLVSTAGALYGVAGYGGAHESGTVFRLTPNQHRSRYAISILYAFRSGADGRIPVGITAGDDGSLYGATEVGGDAGCGSLGGCGTVFRLTPVGNGYKETILHRFRGGFDGAYPQAAVIELGGAIYGTTSAGGGDSSCFVFGCGMIFKLAPSKHGYVETVLHRFHGPDGAVPSAPLIAGPNGLLYGTTTEGGATGAGTVFRLEP